MNSRRALAVVCLLGWMAASAATTDAPTADAILKGEAPAIDYSQAVKCIASYKIERTEPLSSGYILFHLHGDVLWLSQLRIPCPGLSPNSQLSFDQDRNRLCEWDTVRVVYDNGIGIEPRLGPRCSLPKFEPVSPEQVEMLRLQIKKPTLAPEARP